MIQRILPAVLFAGVFAVHFVYAVFLKDPGCGPQATWLSYIRGGELFIGFSFALGASFTAWSLSRFISSRSKGSAAGAAGGTALLAMVAATACFFTGCCGSPMLIVYAGILGIGSLEIPKWSIALLTILSTCLGWWWLTGKNREGKCRCTSKPC